MDDEINLTEANSLLTFDVLGVFLVVINILIDKQNSQK
jgi:hypothetical protein